MKGFWITPRTRVENGRFLLRRQSPAVATRLPSAVDIANENGRQYDIEVVALRCQELMSPDENDGNQDYGYRHLPLSVVCWFRLAAVNWKVIA
jgi:hypothetical protein